jgi:hypothetical protein
LLQIRAVEGKAERRQFVRVPWSIYDDDEHWVPPLLLEREHHISAGNPLFAHLKWCPFLAYRDGKPVGRISAQIDQLHLERYNDATGFFGMIEAPDDEEIFAALFKAAETWLRSEGMQRVRGPYNLSVNEECGLLVEGFDRRPAVMMGHARRYYGARVEEQGYTGAKDLLAYQADIDVKPPPVHARIMKRVMREGGERIKMRSIRTRDLNNELDTMREIFNDAWSDNWGFVPFTEAEFRELGFVLNQIVHPDMVKIIDIDDEPVAFMVVLPDVNEILHGMNGRLFPIGWAKLLWKLKVSYPRAARVPLMGVRKKYQNTIFGPGLAMMLIYGCQPGCLKKGLRDVEMSWVLEDNKPMRGILVAMGGEIAKRYRIYEKSLMAT